jgi:AcrR family transcriptional regulator
MRLKAQDETKTKIMQAAFELFGRYGFDGTSVRQISKKSKVNLAAINYHFQSKDNLFWEIMAEVYKDLEAEIAQYAKDSKNTLDLALKTFDYFMSDKFAVRNTMKMLLIDGINAPAPEIQEQMKNPLGPPGGQFFAEMIQKEVPFELSQEGLLWGVKAIFGTVFHWSTMMCADHICEDDDPLMSEEQIRKDVQGMIEAQLIYLKNNSSRFKK